MKYYILKKVEKKLKKKIEYDRIEKKENLEVDNFTFLTEENILGQNQIGILREKRCNSVCN